MRSTDYHRIEYGSSTISFALEYSDRTTLGIEVNPDSTVVVKAPHNSPLESIQMKVSNRARWITKQQRQFAQYAPTLPAQEYISGEGYRYLGRQYRLKVVGSFLEHVRLWQGKLEVSTNDPENTQQIENLVKSWYRSRSQHIFDERYKYCTQLVAQYEIYHERGFEIRTMEKRWGSCTKAGKIMLNTMLVLAPKDCIDYVLIHELCHIRIHNHSSSFYKLLETIIPDWQQRKDYLNTRIELRKNN
jgi:predicted metal-dependent hydrolase